MRKLSMERTSKLEVYIKEKPYSLYFPDSKIKPNPKLPICSILFNKKTQT